MHFDYFGAPYEIKKGILFESNEIKYSKIRRKHCLFIKLLSFSIFRFETKNNSICTKNVLYY